MTLVEQAQEKMDMEVQQQAAERMMAGIFTFNDMLTQFQQMKKMGSMSSMMRMVPGLNKLVKNIDDEKMNDNMKVSEAII